MRNFVTALVCLGMFAAAANASSIRFYFSTQGDTTGGIPAEYTSQTTPVVSSGQTVYLWATTTYTEIWNGVGMQFGSDEAGFGTDSGVAYNPTAGKPAVARWEGSSDLDPVGDNTIILVGVTTRGLGSYDDLTVYDAGEYVNHTLIGEFAFSTTSGLGDVFLEASGDGITLKGGTTQEDVYFGFGDASIKNNSPTGTRTALPDLSFVPEPASLLLLSFAGLLLRRR